MSLARKIKRQQMRKTKTADMKAFYDHADRVAAGWDKKEKELSEEGRYTPSLQPLRCVVRFYAGISQKILRH